MSEYHDLFVASAGAAAAFIGLLFVAISLAPERVFGDDADLQKNTRALSAFIALVNVFLVSLFALEPKVHQSTFVIIAVVCMLQSLRGAYSVFKEQRTWSVVRRFGILSLGIYALQIWVVLRTPDYVSGLVDIVVALYVFALITAWMLLDTTEHAEKPDSSDAT